LIVSTTNKYKARIEKGKKKEKTKIYGNSGERLAKGTSALWERK
jgi:hypothetical protein